MRKKVFTFVSTTALFSASLMFTGGANADVNNEPSEDPTSIESLSPSDKVILLPDGGILHGKMYDDATSSNGVVKQSSFKTKNLSFKTSKSKVSPSNVSETTTKIYDSETDSHAVTWQSVESKTVDADGLFYKFNQTKQLSNSATPLSAYPANRFKILEAGEYYKSNTFSGTGWHFGTFRVSAASGTGGPYLLWGSHGDAGVVGSTTQAEKTYETGRAYGTTVGNGQQVRISGQAEYYSYSPVPGSYYGVANR